MANAIYPKYKEALLGGESNIALDTGTVKVSLIDNEEIVYSSTDSVYANLNSNGVIATANLETKTITNGVFDADDVLFTSLTGDESEALIIWIDTSNTETSRLVAYMDENVTGLPITLDGSNVQIQWNSSGIFQL